MPAAASSAASASTAVGVARDDRVLRPVEHRDHDLAAVLRQRRRHVFRRREHDGHLAVLLDALHQPRPLGDQRQAVFEAHHAGDARRRILADAVARARCPASTPHDCHNSASAYSSANSAGCVNSV